MMVDALPDLATWLTHASSWHDSLPSLLTHSPDWTVLAQQFNQDLMSDVQKAFNNFVRTGQIWAFFIGIILGYLFKSFTTFG
ncbi:MAG: hypothetical protein SFW36_05965 [Leptolyngbyaceae cyanobacterium bins.59]|nr:hypothetical protein [Leptolyngbyaceae cyanobacterium bins.59]